MSPVEGTHTPIDPADTARQLALFETGNGLQHGVVEKRGDSGAAAAERDPRT